MWKSLVLTTAFLAWTQASVIRVREQTLEARTVEVVEATATTLVQLAEELSLDLVCLTLANPFVVFLTKGQKITVPLACCGTSCKGPLCSQRTQCAGQSTASKATGTATVVITTSTPATTSSSSASVTSSSTTLVTTTSSSSSPSTISSSSTTLITSTLSSSSSSSPLTTSTSSTSITTSSSTSSAPITTSSSSTTSVTTSSSTSSSSTTSSSPPAATTIVPGKLPIALVNNFAGSAVNAYITGEDTTGKTVFIQADGSFYYPNTAVDGDITADIAIPLGAKGSTTTVTTPDYLVSGRIWFAEGTLKFGIKSGALVQPTTSSSTDSSINTNWGFVELTYVSGDGIYANVSYVDFLGLIAAIGLQNSDGSIQSAPGAKTSAVSDVCSALKARGQSDGLPWGELCRAGSNGQPLRVVAPSDYISAFDGSAFASYWTDYANQVWTKYASQDLKIATDTPTGTVTCRVNGDQLTCPNVNRGFSKPNALDIFGCNTGPFALQASDTDVEKAVLARLCAAFDRTTLLIDGGDNQPTSSPSSFYTVAPTNYYSKFVHQNEVDGKGYAFAYDDVKTADGEDQSGFVKNTSPSLFSVYIGGN